MLCKVSVTVRDDGHSWKWSNAEQEAVTLTFLSISTAACVPVSGYLQGSVLTLPDAFWSKFNYFWHVRKRTCFQTRMYVKKRQQSKQKTSLRAERLSVWHLSSARNILSLLLASTIIASAEAWKEPSTLRKLLSHFSVDQFTAICTWGWDRIHAVHMWWLSLWSDHYTILDPTGFGAVLLHLVTLLWFQETHLT